MKQIQTHSPTDARRRAAPAEAPRPVARSPRVKPPKPPKPDARPTTNPRPFHGLAPAAAVAGAALAAGAGLAAPEGAAAARCSFRKAMPASKASEAAFAEVDTLPRREKPWGWPG